ncbi:protein NinF [Atlantibacter hermannii]|uniref:protein NinF n=1 Tax=Atlantibacter hermannii TaxID=565 RepID=UPI0028A7FE2A|nr:protein NinF [Atlantibacter hermannii]
MLSPESIRQYQAESNCRAGYCLHCGTKLAMVETYVCDQCAINLYPDPNTTMFDEDEEDE